LGWLGLGYEPNSSARTVARLAFSVRARIQGGGLRAQGVAVVPATLLRLALGYDQVLSEVDIELLAATARMRLRPAT
jgi:hypothetical protein